MEPIKIISLFIIIFLAKSAMAIDAEVIVLEAPLLSAPDLSARTLQRVRKGKRLFINSNHLENSQWQMNYNVNSNGEAIAQDREEPLFLKTLTTAGEDAWISKKFVKVIYNDEREDQLQMNPYASYDPTDYRIEEPLPDTYPLIDPRKARAYMSFGIGPAAKSGFNYGTTVLEEQIGNKYSFNTIYARKVEFDNFDRFYFGGSLQVSGQRSTYFVSTQRTTQETHGEIGIGPYISYDIYRTENRNLTLFSGFTYNLHRYSVEQGTLDGQFEERLFTGYSITPKLGLSYAIKNFIPGTGLDFILGTETIFNLPYTLTTTTPIEIDELWNDSSEVSYPMAAQFNVFIGIRANY